MKNSKKRGFTIVELVIVIAVIAILAGVLIPTFVSLINKANTSADIQACTQMNKYLAINEVDSPKSIVELYKALTDGGMTAKDYHPLVNDRYFFWDRTLNSIVYTDANYNVLFPENSTATTNNGWYSLSQEIKEVAYTKDNDNVVEVTEAGQLVKIAKDYKTDSAMSDKLTIKLKNDVDMMGASFHIEGNNIELTADTPVTIKGLVNTNYKDMVKNNVGVLTSYGDQIISTSQNSANITIKNITFENMSLGGTNSSDVALVRSNGGTTSDSSITFENVHILNSDFVGTYRMAGFVTHCDKAVTMKDCSIKNSTLTASVGAVAPIFSTLNAKGTFTNVVSENNTVTCTNTDTVKLTSLTINYNFGTDAKTWTVKLPADGIMTRQIDTTNSHTGYRWYPAKAAFGIYGPTIMGGGGTADFGEYPLASGGLDCVEDIAAANNYTHNEFKA